MIVYLREKHGKVQEAWFKKSDGHALSKAKEWWFYDRVYGFAEPLMILDEGVVVKGKENEWLVRELRMKG